MVYGELGQVEIAVAIQQRMVVFWSRIIPGKQSKISYIIEVTQRDDGKRDVPV